ncbi:TPA: ATP-dependent DNA helicase Rep, partial [Klebsiella pneumoniae]|nr:ATP-dependent DNA helicase Rep [Klebsiella pneumoniae]
MARISSASFSSLTRICRAAALFAMTSFSGWFVWLTLYHQSVNLGSAFCYNPHPVRRLSKTPMRLNPGQQQAVEFVTGPCLV